MKIRKGDNVLVLAGKDKGKTGKVRIADPKHKKLLVEGVNFVKRNTKATGQVRQAGIIEREEPVNLSNVALVCGKCNRPTRISSRFLEGGKKVRVCHHCGEVID